MKAMILGAGLGKRMRPLTNNLPKPLVRAGKKMLIEYHLEALANAGFKDVVINTHWCADKMPEALGDGCKWGLSLHYSRETELLETAGGINKALPLLCDTPDDIFLVINGDIYCEFKLDNWVAAQREFCPKQTACLAMIENPKQHPDGDFSLESDDGPLSLSDPSASNRYTYAGLALFKARFFSDLDEGPIPLAPLLKKDIQAGKILGTVMNEMWVDVGTPERLDALNHYLQSSHNE